MPTTLKDVETPSSLPLIYKSPDTLCPGDVRLQLLDLDAKRFNIQNILPPTWELTTSQGGMKSMESLMRFIFNYEWMHKGFVDKNNTKFPYDQAKLAYLAHLLQIKMLADGTFYQVNNAFHIRVIPNLSVVLATYIGYLNAFGHRYGVRFLQEFFDSSLWRSDFMNKNPQYKKYIKFSNQSWSDYFVPSSLNEIPYIMLQINKSTMEYRMVSQKYNFSDWQRPENIQDVVAGLIQKTLTKNNLLRNKEITEALKPVLTDLTDKALKKMFDTMCHEMRVWSKPDRDRTGRGRRLQQMSITKVGEPVIEKTISMI